MRIGVSSWAFPWAVGVPGSPPREPMDAHALVDRAAALGVDVVQVADNLPFSDWRTAQLDELASRAADRGIVLEVGTIGIEPTHLLAHLEIARVLASRLVRVVIDTAAHAPGDDEVVASLGAVLPRYEDAGIDLLVENHDRHGSLALQRLMEEVDSPALGVCLDTVNSLGGHETVETVLERVRPWVRNVHVKDFRIERTPNRMGFVVSGAPLGEGMLDVAALLAGLGSARDDLTLVLEQWPPTCRTVDEAIDLEARWAEQSVEHLRSAVGA